MPRRKAKRGFKRDIGVDLRFNSQLMQKFINVVMERGKKNLARSIMYEAMGTIAQKINGDDKKAYEIFEKAVQSVRPAVEVKSRRVGGGVYQVPVEIRPERATSLTIRWIIDAASK